MKFLVTFFGVFMQNSSVALKIALIGGIVAVFPLLHHAYMVSQMKLMLITAVERGGQFTMPEAPMTLYFLVELIALGTLFSAVRLAGRVAHAAPSVGGAN